MTAPYCFIDFPKDGKPLPASTLWADDTPATAQRMLAGHRQWHTDPDSCTGWIEVTLTALTPLFTGRTVDDDSCLRLSADGPYIIADSTLTGMIRNTVRIITGSRVGPISTPVLFLRTPIPPEKGSHQPGDPTRRKLHGQYARLGGAAAGLRREERTTTNRGGFLTISNDRTATITPIGGGDQLTLPLTVKLDLLQRQLDLDSIAFQLPPRPAQNATNDTVSNNYTPHEAHPGVHRRTFAICYGDDDNINRRVWGVAAITDNRDAREAQRVAKTRGLANAKAHNTKMTQEGKAEQLINIQQLHTCTAVLYMTGLTGTPRSKAYFFPEPDAPRKGTAQRGDAKTTLAVPWSLIELVESAAQITPWQKKNFPADRPDDDGKLARNTPQPVWYTTKSTNGGAPEVVAFGRSGGFRVAISHHDRPAQQVLLDAIPTQLQPRTPNNADPVDITEALFGAADTTGPIPTFRRRVHIGTATPTRAVRVEPPVTVQLLGPQRGCFAHYIQQTTPTGVTTWADTDAALRGYKLYLHRWNPEHTGTLQERLPTVQGASENAGIRTIRPLAPGTQFAFRVTFTNLTRGELGCLLYALHLNNPAGGGEPRNPVSAHKIGLGKGIGLGSIHLASTLYLINPNTRYNPTDPHHIPHPTDGIHTATTTEITNLINTFGATLTHQPTDHWREETRIQQLHQATNWQERLPLHATATMPLKPRPDQPHEPAFNQLRPLPDILNR